MLITVLFCSSLGLAYAVDDGYNYFKLSFQFNGKSSQPQCADGYSGQYPNCVPSTPSQVIPPQKGYLPPSQQQCPSGSFGQFPKCQVMPNSQSKCATGQNPNCVPPYLSLPPQQCPSGSVGQFPNCRVMQPSMPEQQCPPGNFGQYPNCHAIPQPSNLPESANAATNQCTGSDCGEGGEEEGFGGPKTDSEVSFKLLQSSVG